jgi:hypothetical protein
MLAWSLPIPAQACARPTFIFSGSIHRLDVDSGSMLDFAMDVFHSAPGTQLYIQSYTVPGKSEVGALELARLRGESVKLALRRRGVSEKAITMIIKRGAGESGDMDIVYVDAFTPPRGGTCG